MPLNILLADDSVPAQNMGKKILVDAGYSVLTVSNGLEALRKIGEKHPDIAILDIFMPGYTGLEICEKLRANAATSEMPVVLTVGKLEPYRPEDGEHVHSNAVIVKPFAANELIGAVRSLIGAPHETAPEPEPVAVAEPLPDEPEPEEAAYSYAPPAAHEDPDGPQSLRFDPDSKHTGFQASAGDILGSAPATTSKVASAFAAFDLEEDEPGFATAPSAYAVPSDLAPVEVPSFAAAAVAVPDRVPDGAADNVPEFESFAPQQSAGFVAEHPEELPVVAAIPELPVETPDPLLEISERDAAPPQTGVLDSSTLEVGDPPEKIFEEFAPLPETSDVQEPEQLSDEQMARRQAFEELFNSDDPLPVEEPLPVENFAPANVAFPASEAPVAEVEAAPAERTQDEIPSAGLETFTPEPKLEPTYDRDPLLENDCSSASTESPSVESALPESPAEAAEAHTIDSPVIESAASSWQAPAEWNLPIKPTAATQIETIEVPAEVAAFEPAAPMPLPEPEVEVHQVAETPAEQAPVLEAQPEEIAVEQPFAIPATEVAPTEQDLSLAELSPADLATADSELVAGHFASEPMAEADALQVLQRLESLELDQTQPESYETEILAMEVAEAEHIHAEIVPVVLEPTLSDVFVIPPPAPESAAPDLLAADEPKPEVTDAERMHQAVERVFDKFKPLLIAAIVRELARND